MAYNINIEVFEGPFELLFHLIDKEEIDIYDIPIVKITEQYLEYLTKIEELDLELTSEFLVMAATLVSIKSKMLLPKPKNIEADEEILIDPRDELVQRLLEYKKYKEAAIFLKEKETSMQTMFCRKIDEANIIKEFGKRNPVENLNLADLLQAFQEVIKKLENEPYVMLMPKEEITVGQQMQYILSLLIETGHGISFFKIFPNGVSRLEIVVTFLALLELIRQKKIIIRQKNIFEEIFVFIREQ